MARTVHTLKVTLLDVKPRAWRRIEVPSELWLDEPAAVLEEAMGWMGGHLHLFQIDGDTFGMHRPGWAPPGYDPTAFDVDVTTAAMQSPTRVAGW